MVWAPTPEGGSRVEFQHRLHAAAKTLKTQHSDLARIGLGLPGVGAGGWRESAEQALAAHAHPTDPEGVVDYQHMVLEDLSARSANAFAHFNALIDRLEQEAGLLDTLQSLFEQRGHRRLTAEHLGIHPNTLTHRLDRIERVLGIDLEAQRDLSLLFTALGLRGRGGRSPSSL